MDIYLGSKLYSINLGSKLYDIFLKPIELPDETLGSNTDVLLQDVFGTFILAKEEND